MERIKGSPNVGVLPAQDSEIARSHEGTPPATPLYPSPALSDAMFLQGKKSRHAKAELVKRPDLLHCSTPTKKRQAAFVTVYHDGPKIRKAYFTMEGQSVSIKNDKPAWSDFAQFREMIEGSRDNHSPSVRAVADESGASEKSTRKLEKILKTSGETGLAQMLAGHGFVGFLSKEKLQDAIKNGGRRCGIQILAPSRYRLFYSAGVGQYETIYVSKDGYHHPANGGQPEPVTAYLDRQWSNNI